MFPQLRTIFATGSIPGSSTEFLQVKRLKVAIAVVASKIYAARRASLGIAYSLLLIDGRSRQYRSGELTLIKAPPQRWV
jgi:hypothetical protein